ncbi:UDP-glucose dehydrogenase family protein [Saccharothrix obliqua]|uniref:UDP-glucose dehydrogenase family protein n=1 Tax=Saccharothrix obliqua TaxID=2861747 RepID=UPI001C5D206D|nr:UDP-glucose/GDP-mannose dehydrogenase family protein [Saccharothrix obliqua]MBW4720402.1 UDP-glucose/GDP-mannose dehydrogenase family protein [Saccharothrix obliqua]
MSPRITVVGTGYVGTTHAATLAELGFRVLGLDIDEDRVAALSAGRVPFVEPGLDELVARHVATGALRFTTSYREAAAFGDVHFLCVPTPEAADGRAELKPLVGAVEELAPLLTRPVLLVGKSTVPVGTAADLAKRLTDLTGHPGVELAWNPEFLREGTAVADSLRPDRLVFGVSSPAATAALREVYRVQLAAGVPAVVTDPATAELVKLSANTFLATKISFINAVSEVCEAVGADVGAVAAALGHDPRIGGAHLRPGLGFGGGCLPKDLRSFRAQAVDFGLTDTATLLGVVDLINNRARQRLVDLVRAECGGELRGRRVAALGAAFKPDSDDVRDSPALAAAVALHREGAVVTVHDPAAGPTARRAEPRLRHADTVVDACRDADVVVHLTEWRDYGELDPAALAEVVRGRVLVDARTTLDPAPWQEAGWRLRALGRPGPEQREGES